MVYASYDAQSRRISKQLDSTSATYYLYEGWNMIAEYTIPNSNMDPNTTILIGNTYTWGMDLSGSMQGAGGVGGLLAVTENGSSSTAHFYPTYDGSGNVSEYLDANGSAVAHYEYDTFGNQIVSATTGSLAQNFEYRFSTKYLDEESGFYYYGYRYYDPTTGRWPSRDPIEELGGDNLYQMVGNDAIRWIDFLGLDKKCGKPYVYKTERIPTDIVDRGMYGWGYGAPSALDRLLGLLGLGVGGAGGGAISLADILYDGTTAFMMRKIEVRSYKRVDCCDLDTGETSTSEGGYSSEYEWEREPFDGYVPPIF